MNIETAILKITFASVWSKAWPILVAILFFGLIIADDRYRTIPWQR